MILCHNARQSPSQRQRRTIELLSAQGSTYTPSWSMKYHGRLHGIHHVLTVSTSKKCLCTQATDRIDRIRRLEATAEAPGQMVRSMPHSAKECQLILVGSHLTKITFMHICGTDIEKTFRNTRKLN